MVLYDGKDSRITSVHVLWGWHGKILQAEVQLSHPGGSCVWAGVLEILVKKARRFERLSTSRVHGVMA